MSLAELLLILIVALIVLGPKQIPQVAHQVGRFLAKCKRIYNYYSNEIDKSIKFAELQNNIARAEKAELPQDSLNSLRSPTSEKLESTKVDN